MTVGQLRVAVSQQTSRNAAGTLGMLSPWQSLAEVLRAQHQARQAQHRGLTQTSRAFDARVPSSSSSDNGPPVNSLRAEDVPVPSDDDDDL